MNAHTWWYASRATGFVAWALVATAVIVGLILSTRLARRRPTPAWTLDLHRFLGGAALVAILLHLVGLVVDDYVDFGVADLLVPFASSSEPSAVALGIVALYLLLAVQGSSVLMRRLPRRYWRAIPLTSFVAFWASTFHLQLAGTDAANPVARWAVRVAMVAVLFLTFVRIVDGGGKPQVTAGAARALDAARRETLAVQAKKPTTAAHGRETVEPAVEVRWPRRNWS